MVLSLLQPVQYLQLIFEQKNPLLKTNGGHARLYLLFSGRNTILRGRGRKKKIRVEEDVRDIVPGENDLPRKVIFMSLTFVGNR